MIITSAAIVMTTNTAVCYKYIHACHAYMHTYIHTHMRVYIHFHFYF